MNINLNITGTLQLDIFENDTKITNKEILEDINARLFMRELFINLKEQNITDKSFTNVVYSFKFSVLENTEYEFELI